MAFPHANMSSYWYQHVKDGLLRSSLAIRPGAHRYLRGHSQTQNQTCHQTQTLEFIILISRGQIWFQSKFPPTLQVTCLWCPSRPFFFLNCATSGYRSRARLTFIKNIDRSRTIKTGGKQGHTFRHSWNLFACPSGFSGKTCLQQSM